MLVLVKMAAIFLSLVTIVKFALPSLEKDEWEELNKDLNDKLAPFNYHLGRLNNANLTHTTYL